MWWRRAASPPRRPQAAGGRESHQRVGGRKPDAPEGCARRHRPAVGQRLPVTDRKMEDGPRRSVGDSRSDKPRNPPACAAPHATMRQNIVRFRPYAKPRPEPKQPERVSTSRYAKQNSDGEVAAPRGLEIGRQRDAFRAFMIARHLRPSEWAGAAGVPAGEILGFLPARFAPSRPRPWKNWRAPPAARGRLLPLRQRKRRPQGPPLPCLLLN